jgi:hypothetical protein
MPIKSKDEIMLENIKKNDPRFKDMVIKKLPNDFPTYEQFLKDMEEMDNAIRKEQEIICIDESNNNSK